MNLDSKDIIVARLVKELADVGRVALGEGIPSLVKPFLGGHTKTFPIPSNGQPARSVDVAVVEALEVSPDGSLVAAQTLNPEALSARRWIVATRHTREDGEPKLVRACRMPLSLAERVTLVITELGVIEISGVGMVLREVAPGVATDDVKLRTRASLHVADDIRLMEL